MPSEHASNIFLHKFGGPNCAIFIDLCRHLLVHIKTTTYYNVKDIKRQRKKNVLILLSRISCWDGGDIFRMSRKYTNECTHTSKIIICLNVLSFYSCFIYVYFL